MNIKYLLSPALAAAMLLSMLASCGGTAETAPQPPAGTDAAGSPVEETEAETSETEPEGEGPDPPHRLLLPRDQ